MASPPRVVITGLGIVSPIGHTVEQFEAALRLGRSALRVNDGPDAAGYAPHLLGRITGFEAPAWFSRFQRRHTARIDQYVLTAADEAVRHAALSLGDALRRRTGIVLGSGGAIAHTEAYIEEELRGLPRHPSRALNQNPDVAGTMVAAHFGLQGPRSSVMTACSSGALALGFAADLIRGGHADVMLSGGAEALSKVTLSGFHALKALSGSVNRPFDKDRDGIALGEAAAVLVMESLEHARARRAPILAEFAACGLACDAHHVTAPHPEGRGLARAMRMALRQAGLGAERIGYINAHGTGTALNDTAEYHAIQAVFGPRAGEIPVSSIKPFVGHTLSAAGGLEAAATVLALKGQFLPPNLNFATPDPACPLNVVANRARNHAFDHAMKNALAFGGNNVSLILKRWD